MKHSFVLSYNIICKTQLCVLLLGNGICGTKTALAHVLCVGILTKENTGVHVLHWLLLFNCYYTMGEYAHLQESTFPSGPRS